MSKFKLQRTQERTRTQHEDGKQDAWNGHAQVASQAVAVPEEYGPDAERQEVKRDETRIQNSSAAGQEDDLGQSQEREERDHQRERVSQDNSNEAILTATDVEKSFLERNKEGVG